MKFPPLSLLVTFTLSLIACQAEPAPTAAWSDKRASMPIPTASTEQSHARNSQTDPTALLTGKLHNGMAYSAFRKVALDNAWQPKPDAQCMANVVGGDYKTWCPAHPDDVMCKVCSELPELSSCSGDGHCLMQFAHEGVDKDLAVGTYGDINNWNAPADKSGLMVTGWEYNAPQTH